MVESSLPLTPEVRHRGELPGGVPLVIGEETWYLPSAETSRLFDQLRDKLFDHQTLTGQVLISDLDEAAYLLLWINYDLTPEEVARLLIAVESKPLADAVIAALFGADRPHRTYTAWVQSALWSNGIDPSQVPSHLIPMVLRHLVQTWRAEPASTFIEAVEAAGKRRMLMARIGQIQAKPPTDTQAT